MIEPKDSYVDAYSLADQLGNVFSDSPGVVNAASAAMNAVSNAVVTYTVASGTYIDPLASSPLSHTWQLDNSHGLTIFFPLLADLLMGGKCQRGQTVPSTDCFSLKVNYTAPNFAFVNDDGPWGEIIAQLATNESQVVNLPRPGLLEALPH